MIPPSLPSKASKGEKRLYNLLRDKLANDFYVWYEPIVQGRYPDFIVLGKNFGLLVIEVKGWYPNQILEGNSHFFKIRSIKNSIETTENQKSPLRQCKEYLDKILNQFPQYRILQQQQGNYKGKIAFPVGLGAIMSNITEEQATNLNLNKLLGQPQVAYRDELLAWENISSENLIRRLEKMFTVRFPFPPLTSDQISTIKGILYPEIIVRSEQARPESVPGFFAPLPNDTVLKTLDSRQESLARSIGEGHRIFFGVSGSGKTLLLIARAKMLTTDYPEARILILCFNVSLASHLRSILHQQDENSQYKKIEVTNFHEWAGSILGSLPSSVSGNFDEYVGDKVLQKLSSYTSEQKWDAILVDEAHTFVPLWFRCCVQALKDSENGDLMIVADGSQSLYKRSDFKWKEVGIKAQGRTISKNFDLDKNYRNTREILSAAWGLLNRVNQQGEMLDDEEVTFPTVQPSLALRNGSRPQIHVVSTSISQEQAVINQIQKLHKLGCDFREIAILYRQANKDEQKKLQEIMNHLKGLEIESYWVTKSPNNKKKYSINIPGIRLITCLSALGLEFKAVLILWLEQFSDCSQNTQGTILARRQLYVAMTRTQEYLHLFTSDKNKFVEQLEQSQHFEIVSYSTDFHSSER
jgi:hypothetical protein